MNKVFFIITAAVIAAFSSAVSAQNAEAPDESLIPDLAKDADMKIAPGPDTLFVPSFGGWITPVFAAETKSGYTLVSSPDTVRLWGRMSLGGSSFIYIRGRDTYNAVLKKSGSALTENENSFDIESAYAQLGTSKNEGTLAFGRKYFNIGTGLVVSGRGDGGQCNVKSKYGDLQAFGFYTGYLGIFKTENNTYGLNSLDASDGSKRFFAGAVLEEHYLNQTAYLFGVAQTDRGSQNAGETTRYSSQYYGAGIKGYIIDGMDYYAEGVYERGQSPLSDKSGTTAIAAWAAVSGINYYPDMSVKPSLSIQYGYGSGDKDRTNTMSSDGNIAGRDNGFLAFGSFTGGYALKPALSNIHVIRGGGSILPFAQSKSIARKMSIGARYIYYILDKKSGTINTGECSNSVSRRIGQGADIIYRWSLFHDLSLFANYGMFVPGKAYSDSEKMRHVFTAGMNIVF